MSGGPYFFLYPAGHFGFAAVTFLTVEPFTQVIVVVFWAGLAAAVIALLTSLRKSLRDASDMQLAERVFSSLA